MTPGSIELGAAAGRREATTGLPRVRYSRVVRPKASMVDGGDAHVGRRRRTAKGLSCSPAKTTRSSTPSARARSRSSQVVAGVLPASRRSRATRDDAAARQLAESVDGPELALARASTRPTTVIRRPGSAWGNGSTAGVLARESRRAARRRRSGRRPRSRRGIHVAAPGASRMASRVREHRLGQQTDVAEGARRAPPGTADRGRGRRTRGRTTRGGCRGSSPAKAAHGATSGVGDDEVGLGRLHLRGSSRSPRRSRRSRTTARLGCRAPAEGSAAPSRGTGRRRYGQAALPRAP